MNDDTTISIDMSRPEREREAFASWVECNNLSQVSRDLGIPYRTLQSWQEKYGWKHEKTGWLREYGELAIDRGKYAMALAVETAAKRLTKMLEDDEASHADQRENIRLLKDFIFDPTSGGPGSLIDARQIHITSPAGVDPFQQATSLLEANVAKSASQNRRGSRKTF